jgi:hypothetical protein
LPRLNVEDEWFDDPRRAELVERIGIAADGVALRMWRLSQIYFRVGGLVPIELFEKIPHWQEFEAVGLADRRKDGVYIKGQRERFAWIQARSDAGKVGGPAAAKKRKENKRRTATSNDDTNQQPTSSSSSSSSPSSSSSTSDSVSKKSLSRAKAQRSPAKTSAVWEAYSEAYTERFGNPPADNVEERKHLSRLIDKIGADDAPEIARFYLKHPNAFYIGKGYPTWLLAQDAQKLRSEWQRGSVITGQKAREIERKYTNAEAFGLIDTVEEKKHG